MSFASRFAKLLKSKLPSHHHSQLILGSGPKRLRFIAQMSTCKAMAEERNYFVLPLATPIVQLDCQSAFNGLTPKERLYAHQISLASWNGGLITYLQVSPESAAIFVLLRRLITSMALGNLKTLAVDQCDFSDSEFDALLLYAVGFFGFEGNYKDFGDTKVIPDLPKEKFRRLIDAAKVADAELLWHLAGDKMFSLGEKQNRLGLWDVGVTSYHSRNVTKSDTKLIERFMTQSGIEAWNTRLFKDSEGNFEIRLASVETGLVEEKKFENVTVRVTKGDYSPLLKRLVKHLELAQNYTANENQLEMLKSYVAHFTTGDLKQHKEASKHWIKDANENQLEMLKSYVAHFTTGDLKQHKEASKHWIKDVGPIVESYIGFIENYRDPVGQRSEFEGFAAAVNKETTEKFTRLVANATQLLPRLPWGKDYEKDKFLQPDFTSLDVINFASAGIPAGINIPNYDDIRQNVGFKNVALGNVISAVPKTKIPFLSNEDEALYKRYMAKSFEVQVGLHELLGHGSGKLFERQKDGTFNFDQSAVKDLLTGEKISKWYEAGETWGTKFGRLSNAYEECRAEAVGYYLSTFPDVLKIFGYEGSEAEDIKYVNWLYEVRAGLTSLEFYSPDTKAWGQAHSHARFVLLRVVMEAGGDFVQIEEVQNATDCQPDLKFTLDRTKIDAIGAPAIYEFLKKLQHYKSTGDFTGGSALFAKYSTIDEKLLKWRQIAIDRRQPRRIFLQSNTVANGDNSDVKLVGYEETREGFLHSIVDRYADGTIDAEMLALVQKDFHHFYA